MSIVLTFFEIDFTELTIEIHNCPKNAIFWANRQVVSKLGIVGKGGNRGGIAAPRPYSSFEISTPCPFKYASIAPMNSFALTICVTTSALAMMYPSL